MKFMQVIALVAMLVAGGAATANDADPVAHLKAMEGLMRAMQAEKMMRTITGQSGFPVEAQRASTFAKLAKMPPAEIHARLGRQSRTYLSQASAEEMTRYFSSAYGKQVLHQTYNGSASLMGPVAPVQTAAERKDFSRPAFIKAKKEFDKAEPLIRHEGFKLMQAINRS